MWRDDRYLFSRLTGLLDYALTLGAFFLTHFLRSEILQPLWPNLIKPSHMGAYVELAVLVPPLTVFALALNGHYDPERVRTRRASLRTVALSVLEAMALTLLALYFMKRGEEVSRAQALVYPLIVFMAIGLRTVLLRRWMARARAARPRRRVVLAGGGEPLSRLIETLRRHPTWGFAVDGILSDDPNVPAGAAICGVAVLGALGEAREHIWDRHVDAVLIAPAGAGHEDLCALHRLCAEMGIAVYRILESPADDISSVRLEWFGDLPALSHSPVRAMDLSRILKFLIDRVGALLLLVVLSPILLLLALAIRLGDDSGAPVLFAQTRVGLNGRLFRLWKFRTMEPGAEARLEALRAQSDVDGPVFKMRDDPRVTRVGRFLRRWSLDELPQLYNVLRGEMSLVGPRPALPDEVQRYAPWQRRRLSMRPGITCLWQVRGRSEVDFETWMRYDLEYIDNWSLWLDATILIRTLGAVVSGRGAL